MRPAASAVSAMNSQSRRRGLRARRQQRERRGCCGGRQLGAVADALAQVRQRDLGVVAVDLAREPVAVEDHLREQPRGHAIADPEDRLAAAVELVVERIQRHALRDEHDAGGLELEWIAVLVVAAQAAGLDAGRHRAGAHDDAALVQARAYEHVLERLGAVRGDRGVARHELDLATLAGEQLGQRGRHQVAVAVVDDHAAGRRAQSAEHDLLGREDVRRGRLGAGDRRAREPVEAVGRPLRSGREHDRGGAVRRRSRPHSARGR